MRLAVDLGGTQVRVAQVADDGAVITRSARPTPIADPTPDAPDAATSQPRTREPHLNVVVRFLCWVGAVDPEGMTRAELRKELSVPMLLCVIPFVAIGAGTAIHAALVGSVFIAGLPEAMGISAALLAGGLTLGKILFRFSWVVLIGAVSAAIGYVALYQASDVTQAVIQSVAAGALLVVVVNEMIPIAVRGVKRWAGVIAAVGFVFSAGLTWATGG